jgi:hypothetical protein
VQSHSFTQFKSHMLQTNSHFTPELLTLYRWSADCFMLKTQFILQSKHFSSWLWKATSWRHIGKKSLFFLREIQNTQIQCGRQYSSWMLNRLMHHLTSRLQEVNLCSRWPHYEQPRFHRSLTWPPVSNPHGQCENFFYYFCFSWWVEVLLVSGCCPSL